jgi:hypothetical protein
MASSTFQPSPTALTVVLLGAAFSFGVSVVPHFDSAHQLLGVPFAASVGLYGLYAVIAALTPAAIADGLGLRLIALHLVMGILLRSSIAPAEVAGMLTLVPVLLIVYALVDVYLRTRRGGAAKRSGGDDQDGTPGGASAANAPS